MNIIGIIPARYGSKRFPGKPLIDLKGKPMIQRVYEGARKSKELSRVIVATDDQRIVDVVEQFGGEAQLTSTEHTTGTDRCAELARGIDADIILNIQGDEPLVDHRQLDQLCKAFNDPEVSIATLGNSDVSKEDFDNPNRVKIILDKSKNALYFSRSGVPNTKNGSASAIENYPFLRHIGLYAYRKSTLLELTQLPISHIERVESLEQLRWLYNGYKVRVVETTIETPNIDVPEDIEKVLGEL